MNRFRRFRSADGQVTVMAAVLMVFLVAMVAFVLDVGSWFREQRSAQSTVDAAALAGAQSLPFDPASASTIATTYAQKNGGVAGLTITIGSKWTPNDQITVTQSKPAAGFFSKVLGISAVTVHAHATAISEQPSEPLGVAPIAVNILHPKLSGPGCPCLGSTYPTTLPLGKTGAPGSFTMLNLDQSNQNGTVGASTMADWLTNGFNQYLDIGDYFSDPGAKFNDSQIQNALLAENGQELLFPIYDTLIGTGSNADYHVIAWVGFHLTGSNPIDGNTGTISGYFTRVIRHGIVSSTGPPTNVPDYGVRSVALIN
jgi:Flp pilus assembly protein TadG